MVRSKLTVSAGDGKSSLRHSDFVIRASSFLRHSAFRHSSFPLRRIPAMAHHPISVLVSGGLDSAVLLGRSLDDHPAVHPLYVRTGLAWEEVELAYLHRFLLALARPALKPLVVLDLPARDRYDVHWSVTGRVTPDASAPDEEFFLPGRNV